MKIRNLILISFLVIGCGKEPGKEVSKNNSPNPSTERTVKELTLKDKVVGFYEGKYKQGTNKLVLWENGEFESYRNGAKRFTANWKINKNGELNVAVKEKSKEALLVFRINSDHSLTGTTATINGKQEVLPGKDQITFAKIKTGAKGSPPTVKSMLTVIGEPLTKDEENFAGRRKGESEEPDGTGFHYETVYRRDHTYSLSTLYLHTSNDGEEGGASGAVDIGGEEWVVHGIWRIIGDHVYFLDLVDGNQKITDNEQEVTWATLSSSDKNAYGLEFPESKDEDGVIFPVVKYLEETVEKLKHPGMWPYNSPNALESFDLLTAYKHAIVEETNR